MCLWMDGLDRESLQAFSCWKIKAEAVSMGILKLVDHWADGIVALQNIAGGITSRHLTFLINYVAVLSFSFHCHSTSFQDTCARTPR